MMVPRLGRVSRGTHTYRVYCCLFEFIHVSSEPQDSSSSKEVRDIQFGTPDPISTARSQDRTGQLMYSLFHPHTKILAGWEPPQFVIARTSWYVLPYVTQVGTRLVDMLLALTR